MTPRRRRLGLYVPWALFLVFCLGWTGYWYAIRTQTLHALATITDTLKGAGGSLDYSSVKVTGFPLHLTMTFKDLRLRHPRSRVTIETGLAPISINLSNPRHMIVGWASPLRLTLGARTYQLDAAHGEMSIRFDAGDALQRFSIILASPTLVGDSGLLSTADLFAFHLRPAQQSPRDIQLVLELKNWSGGALAQPLGRLCPCGHVRAALEGPAPASLAPSLSVWRGSWKIVRFDIAGKSGAYVGDGAVTLDPQHRLRGDLTVAIDKAPPVTLHAGDRMWTLDGAPVAPNEKLQLLSD